MRVVRSFAFDSVVLNWSYLFVLYLFCTFLFVCFLAQGLLALWKGIAVCRKLYFVFLFSGCWIFLAWRCVWLHEVFANTFCSLVAEWGEWGLRVRCEIGGLDQDSLVPRVRGGLVSGNVSGKFRLLHVAAGRMRSGDCPP